MHRADARDAESTAQRRQALSHPAPEAHAHMILAPGPDRVCCTPIGLRPGHSCCCQDRTASDWKAVAPMAQRSFLGRHAPSQPARPMRHHALEDPIASHEPVPDGTRNMEAEEHRKDCQRRLVKRQHRGKEDPAHGRCGIAKRDPEPRSDNEEYTRVKAKLDDAPAGVLLLRSGLRQARRASNQP